MKQHLDRQSAALSACREGLLNGLQATHMKSGIPLKSFRSLYHISSRVNLGQTLPLKGAHNCCALQKHWYKCSHIFKIKNIYIILNVPPIKTVPLELNQESIFTVTYNIWHQKYVNT